MSNPKYQAKYQPELLEIESGSYGRENIIGFHLRSPFLDPPLVYLDKPQVQDLIAQLQSWIDTGDWIKPKKKYVGLYKNNEIPVLYKNYNENTIYDACGTDVEIYELTEENRVK